MKLARNRKPFKGIPARKGSSRLAAAPTARFRSLEALEGRLMLTASVVPTMCVPPALSGWTSPANRSGIIYVDDTAPLGGDGTTWGKAFQRLQDALGAAAGNPAIKTIRVAEGRYTPGATSADAFQLRSGLTLQGGFPDGGGLLSSRDWDANPTILSGDIGNDDLAGVQVGDNSAYVLSASGVDASTVLDGFTVTASVTAGLFVSNGSPTIRNCDFTANFGKGILSRASVPDPYFRSVATTLTVVGCDFTANGGNAIDSRADNENGAVISSLNIWNSTFNGNDSTINGNSSRAINNNSYSNDGPGSSLAVVVLADCSFFGNSGFAVFNSANATDASAAARAAVNLTDCDFDSNSTAVSNRSNTSYAAANATVAATRCDFTDNSGSAISNRASAQAADTSGAANGLVSLLNCSFTGNAGGGVGNSASSLVASSASLAARNSAFVGNGGDALFNIALADSGAATGSLTTVNCTFTGNAGAAIHTLYSLSPVASAASSSTLTVTNSILWGDNAGNGEIVCGGSAPTIKATYSDIQMADPTSVFAGACNINADPQFVSNPSPGPDGVWCTADDAYGDVHLRRGSPCIDTGTNSVGWMSPDLDGNRRIVNRIVDMGAYEYQGQFINFLSPVRAYFAGRSIPIQFGLIDRCGHALAAMPVASVTVTGALGTYAATPGADPSSYVWDSIGAAPGIYTITVVLQDGTTASRRILLARCRE